MSIFGDNTEDGKFTCPNCHGTGVVTCSICNGKGKSASGEPCSICHGQGRVQCPECSGNGNKQMIASLSLHALEFPTI